MSKFIVKKTSFLQIFAFLQIVILLVYFFLNISNVGELGVAIPLLAFFLSCSIFVFLIDIVKFQLRVSFHFFAVIAFILWLTVKVILDLNDIYYLKQVTIATTGGILIFFITGMFTRRLIELFSNNQLMLKFLLLIFMFLCFYVFSEYSSRLIRTDLFYIDDVDGGYQRPGNFFIIVFIICSFIFLNIVSNVSFKRIINFTISLIIYSFAFVVALVSSQMIGSNAATINLIAIYLLTLVVGFLGSNSNLQKQFFSSGLSFPFSKKGFLYIFKYSTISLFFLSLFISFIVFKSNFDLSTTRIFGFGSGSNSSIDTRAEIFREYGVQQLGYSPFFGDLNVAKIITGDSGKTLHTLIPNIMAELGIVGLLIFLMILFFIFKNLFYNMHFYSYLKKNFTFVILNFWLLWVLVFLFLYSNISVGKSWPVIWFYFGFVVSVFRTNEVSR